MNPLTHTKQKQTGMVTACRVNDLLRQNKKKKNKKFSAKNYRLTTGTCKTISQMLVQMFCDITKRKERGDNDRHAHCDLRCNITLARLDRTGQSSGSANFALGSASSQLQEVLVTDLPRSFNRGEREKPEREEGGRGREREGEGERERERGREREMKERRGGRGGG